MLAFIYPRTISIRRPSAPATGAVGAQPYQALVPADESVIASGLPASIQEKGRAGRGDVGLPADTTQATIWQIFIPGASAALGGIQNRDIVVDDLGNRYQVIAAYWNSLGFKLKVTLLEA